MERISAPRSVLSRRKLMIVDDDPAMLDSLKLILDRNRYEIFEVGSSKSALALIPSVRPDLILSDFKMPEMDGLQLFHATRSLNIPFIIMTGFSDVLDLQSANDLGLSEFIFKPFSKDDLTACLELVEHQRQVSDGDRTEINLDSEYCRVSVDEFLSGSKTEQDTYIRLSSTKFLRIAKKESPLNPARLKSYKNKGVEYLYIKKDDFARPSSKK